LIVLSHRCLGECALAVSRVRRCGVDDRQIL